MVVQKMSDWTIDVQDFQSIKKAHIEVPSGLTIITGKTNEGKSAIYRAIDCALFNTGTDDLVRAGKKIAGVTISNGKHTMTYCRNAVSKNEKTAYQFDGGNVQKKVGRSQLPEVQQMFGITDVRMQNGVKMKLNFWGQGEKPFLMDKTAGQLYEFLSLSSAEKYFKILKSMAADIKVQEAEINNSNTVIDTLKSVNNSKQEFLDKNKGFDDVYTKIITVGQEADKLNKNLSIIELLESLQGEIDSISGKLKEVTDRYNNIPMDSISNSSEYDKLFGMVSSVASTRKSISGISEALSICGEQYSRLDSVSESIKDSFDSVVELESYVSKASMMIMHCNKISEDISDISQRISDISDKSIDINSLRISLDSVISLQMSQEDLSKMIVSIQSTNNNISMLDSKVLDLSKDMSDKESELEDLKSTVGYCPFCGSVFDKSIGHSH